MHKESRFPSLYDLNGAEDDATEVIDDVRTDDVQMGF